MSNWNKHDVAFKGVQSHAILKDGKPIAKVAFKKAPRGNRVTVYLHYIGYPMMMAYVDGTGYNKHDAAMYDVAIKLKESQKENFVDEVNEFVKIIIDGGSHDWADTLSKAGYVVFTTI